jgi:hypothetical protein
MLGLIPSYSSYWDRWRPAGRTRKRPSFPLFHWEPPASRRGHSPRPEPGDTPLAAFHPLDPLIVPQRGREGVEKAEKQGLGDRERHTRVALLMDHALEDRCRLYVFVRASPRSLIF